MLPWHGNGRLECLKVGGTILVCGGGIPFQLELMLGTEKARFVGESPCFAADNVPVLCRSPSI